MYIKPDMNLQGVRGELKDRWAKILYANRRIVCYELDDGLTYTQERNAFEKAFKRTKKYYEQNPKNDWFNF